MKRIPVFLLLCCLCAAPGKFVAQNPSVDVSARLYAEIRQLFLHEDYGMARQLLEEYLGGAVPDDCRREAEYMLVCADYALGHAGRMEMIRRYLATYPDTPHANRLNAMLASAYFHQGNYKKCRALLEACELYLLDDEERDACTYRMGVSCLKAGDLQEAAVWFRTLEGVSSSYRNDARYHLAYIDYARGNYAEALPVFLSLQEDAKYSELVPYYIADIYLQRRAYAQAEEMAASCLASGKEPADALEMWRIQGMAQYHQAKYRLAAGALKKYCSQAASPGRDTWYALAMSDYRLGQYADAAAMFAHAAGGEDMLSQNALLHRGLSLLQVGDKLHARMAFEQASSLSFDLRVTEEALYNYALCIHETAYSPFDESVTVFERFLNEFPTSAYAGKVSDYLVEVYMNTRSYEAALNSIAKIEHPDSRILKAKQRILFQLGTQSFANARFEESVDYFKRSLQLGRYDVQTKADAFYWLGETCYRLEKYGEAVQNLRSYLNSTLDKAAEMHALAYYTLGYIRFKAKDYEAARSDFSQALQLSLLADKAVLADIHNRIGDCDFHARRFAEAQQNYSEALQLDASLGDYSLYQEAFVLGLQKDYLGKVHLLNKLASDFPHSQYLDDAYYERGRAYVMMEDNGRAIASYKELLARYPESAMARRAAGEIGLLYYQDDNYEEAIKAYKEVILSYPGSEEARMAQRDLKSIYVDLNKVDAYASFVDSIPGGANFEASERDSLTYMAAEKMYTRQKYAEARESFLRYLQAFPDGAFSIDAHYYIGLMDYNSRRYASSLQHFEKILAFPDNKYSENAMAMAAEVLFDSGDYRRALSVYKQLAGKASASERRIAGWTGALRCAYALNDVEETISSATRLLNESKLPPELANEAHYYRAKVYWENERARDAVADLKYLSGDTRNNYGAEAKYLLAQAYFDSGDLAGAEKEVLDYIEISTPHAYWLARSFVLLSDIYLRQGRGLEAKQYLLSLQQNYHADDDIAGMIEERLEKLNKE